MKNALQTDVNKKMAENQNGICPLCSDSRSPKLLGSVLTSKIWSEMVVQLGAQFSSEVVASYANPARTSLVQCLQCELHYFLPLKAGDSRFYGELTSTAAHYYSQEKWDFTAALSFLSPGSSLLDVACGSGHFVSRATAYGVKAWGIDSNLEAVAEAQKMGRPVEATSLEDFARQNQEAYDVVTAFQIIEHIPEVSLLINSMIRCLKPGGLLIITVPNRLRRFRNDFEPLDHPPHHLSHWSAAQLEYLAHSNNLKVRAIRYQLASMHEMRAVMRKWLAAHLPLQSESILARLFARFICGPTLFQIYSRMGLLSRWQMWSLSVMAVLQRPTR
jgi:SAM-dependent methyltransferase